MHSNWYRGLLVYSGTNNNNFKLVYIGRYPVTLKSKVLICRELHVIEIEKISRVTGMTKIVTQFKILDLLFNGVRKLRIYIHIYRCMYRSVNEKIIRHFKSYNIIFSL